MAPKPAGLYWAAAAALPVAAETALRVLGLLEVARGDTVLIHSAAGAVGTVAVQIAVARGGAVIGTASELNHDYLRELGATPMLYGGGLVDRVRALRRAGSTPRSTSPVRERCRTPSSLAAERPAS